MAIHRIQLFRPIAFLIPVLVVLSLFATGCSGKKASLAGGYQGTWKTEKHEGLLKFSIGSDRSLIGEINFDDASSSPVFLGGPVEEDGSFSLKIGDKDQFDGYLELTDSGILNGHGTIKPSRHSLDFTLRRAETSNTTTVDSEEGSAPVVQTFQQVPQQPQTQPQTSQTSSQYTPPPVETRKPIYYAALITRTSDTKQAYVLWSKRRDGSQENFQNRIMLFALPQFSSGNHSHCEVTFMNSDQLPSTAVELREIESVSSFANP